MEECHLDALCHVYLDYKQAYKWSHKSFIVTGIFVLLSLSAGIMAVSHHAQLHVILNKYFQPSIKIMEDLI
jgi:hypothetical protein